MPHETPLGVDVMFPVPVPERLTLSAYADAPPLEALNVAVTVCAPDIETAHVPVPEHAPPHPANTDPLSADWTRLTDMPAAKLAWQVLPQLIPAGADDTVPLPEPSLVTASVADEAPLGSKSAATDSEALMITVQVVLLPEQAPLHPPKVEPWSGVAVSPTSVPAVKLPVHVVPQLIAPGEETTDPVPPPVLPTLSV